MPETGTKSKRAAKASVRLRIECLKQWLRSNDLPRKMGSEIKESPNYSYRRVRPNEVKIQDTVYPNGNGN